MSLSKWITFIQERFSPWTTLPMIALFVLANGLLACRLAHVEAHWSLFLAAFVLMLSAFFRLRLFDELKDYETDRKFNPQRPLARGLLTTTQVLLVAGGLIIFELVFARFLGLHVLLAQAIAIVYSLLMYKEFYVGEWLRPQLLLYAITHTFVCALLAYSIASVVTTSYLWQLPVLFILSTIMNWSLFNLFEFARKTFAPSEERAQVDSYSSLYGLFIAVTLTLMAAVTGIVFAFLMLWKGLEWFLPGFLVLFAAGNYLIITRSVHGARLFRYVSGAFILYFYVILAWLAA